jgi:8-oxo-dGTP pyrophosphatase MutT (NUDIX family)
MVLVYSAGIVPVKDDKFLMLRNRHYIDFPKGKLEHNETFLGAALRECKEESGLWDLDFVWGTDHKDTAPYKTSLGNKKAKKISRYYVAKVVTGDVKILPNEETGVVEHDQFYWVTYQEAQKLPLSPRIKEILDWANDMVEGNNAGSASKKS